MQVTRAFRKKGFPHRLHVAGDGYEALEMMRSQNGKSVPKPHIILLDLHMPRMGGFEFLRELRKDPNLSHISVFIMTTSVDESDKDQAYALNAAGYIVKPVSVEKFNMAMEKLSGFWDLIEFPD
jgi:CheY-like chemotaxis protein